MLSWVDDDKYLYSVRESGTLIRADKDATGYHWFVSLAPSEWHNNQLDKIKTVMVNGLEYNFYLLKPPTFKNGHRYFRLELI